MKPVMIGLGSALMATPALAHGGAHLHPHGSEHALLLILALGIGVAAAFALRK